MEALIEFFTHLFDTSDWPPRWYCGEWSDFHGWLYIFSDIGIWLAYFIIPMIIIWFIQRKPDVPFLPVFWLFGAFIIFCGATHLLDAVMFWWPAYRLSAIFKFLTAVISMFTVFALIRDLPKLLALQTKDTPGEQEGVNELDLALNKIERLEKELAEYRSKE